METMTVEQARLALMENDGEAAARPAGGNQAEVGDPAAREAPAQESAAQESAAQEPTPAQEQRSYADGSVGLGVDIVEIERMERILERRPAFADQVFSPEEQEYCNAKARPATHYALRFAAKEAVVKALGTGFAEGVGVRDIEVERDKRGRPSVKLSGRALEVAEEQGVRDLSLSLSYTRTDAVACALAQTESSIRASEKRKDPMEELSRQFKETRKMLDEL